MPTADPRQHSRNNPANISIATLIAQARATALSFAITCPDDLAAALVQRLIKHAGGQKIYIPTPAHSKAQQRNAKICAQFTGANTADLARQYKITPKQIRNILRQASRNFTI